MSRRSRAEKRETPPDPKFESRAVTKFINNLMVDGKKSKAEKIFYDAVDIMEQRSGENGVEMFEAALNNAKPALEVKSRRVGGATYQVPVEVRENRRMALSIRWVIQNARQRSGRTMADKLTAEIMDAFNNSGGAIKKKEEVHRMAEANKAFAHYRW